MTNQSYAPSSLILNALNLRRGERWLIKDLSLTLLSGEILLVQGANGSGKTSLLRVICGLLAPARGDVQFHRDGAIKTGYDIAAHCHLLGHQDGLKSGLTVCDNLMWLSQILAKDSPFAQERPAAQRRKMIFGALEMLHLGALLDTPVRLLSAGQRRRVALARLILVPRPIWLLDEPGNALDINALQSFETLVKAHVATNGLVLIATHQAFALPNARTHHLLRPRQADFAADKNDADMMA